MEIEPHTLRELLEYDPETGVLTWRERPRKYFKSDQSWKMWNGRHSGKVALTHINPDGYKVGAVFSKVLRLHRVVWAIHYGSWPKQTIDHISGDKTDNRIANLRDVTHHENCKNRPIRSDNISGAVGVSWHAARKAWVVNIAVNKRQKYIGLYDEKADAIAARASAEIKYNYHANHGRQAQ